MAELKEPRAAVNPGSAAPTTLCAGRVGHATFELLPNVFPQYLSYHDGVALSLDCTAHGVNQ